MVPETQGAGGDDAAEAAGEEEKCGRREPRRQLKP
jgi:hypothetical protein